MPLSTAPRRFLVELALPVATLFILALYTYACFFVVPYLGFEFFPGRGEITEIYTEQAAQHVQLGDLIREANGVAFEDYANSLSTPLFEGVQAGEPVHMLVEQDGQLRSVEFAAPGFNLSEFLSRLVNTWWLSYAFWLAGTITLLHVRPKDMRWVLLIAFCYVTAIWLMAGSFSAAVVYSSTLVFRAAIWFSLPVYLHLHWNFPRAFRQLPVAVWAGLYVFAAFMALAQLLDLLPSWLYILPLLAGMLGSFLLLVARMVGQPEGRAEVRLLLISIVIAVVPTLILGFISAIGVLNAQQPGSLISLLAWPGGYFYVVYRRQLAGLELRANRLISLYLFFLLLLTVSVSLMPLLSPYLQNPQEVATATLVTGLVVSVFSVFAFERFQRFVEQRLLKIPLPPEGLLQNFAGRISTSLTHEHLAGTLQNEVLPSLLIRQSALLQFDAHGAESKLVYAQGLEGAPVHEAASWVQLSIPIRVGEEPLGVWLLGRKDPDDYYSYAEQRTLASLADQMGIALANIQQADNLRVLYRQDIDRQEERRAWLARELHDDVLTEMNDVFRLLQQEGANGFSERQQRINDRVRGLIYRLRPAMLDFGLYHALTELVDNLSSQAGGATQVSLMIPAASVEYSGHVAEHAYRIVQQAAENALHHGKPNSLGISGRLEAACIDLLVEDDGAGFDLGGAGLPQLLQAGHYGLAGMSERAALIGARLDIQSAPGEGTRVHLFWEN